MSRNEMRQDAPRRHLSGFDAVCIIVGIIVGAGIFGLPQLVAAASGSAAAMLGVWVAGGILCLCGALTYAELTTAYPDLGGEYVFLRRAFGPTVGFLFVWSRATVIQTGSIAAVACVFGIYAARLMNLGPPAPMIAAAAAVVVLTACNVIGVRAGKWTQNVLTLAKIGGVLAVAATGLVLARPAPAASPAPEAPGPTWTWQGLGFAMIFVLFTFGGWNEAAYVAGELRRRRRTMLGVLLVSIGLVTVLYLGVNVAYLRALGLEGMVKSKAVAAETAAAAFGEAGAAAVSLLVAVSALGAVDGCIFTGSRAICALGGDFPVFGRLGRWHPRFRTPANAILVQSAIAIVLILLPGMGQRLQDLLGSDLEAAVSYTAPVFWAFLLLTGASVFILRYRDPDRERPFRVPLAPLTVGAFCLASGYMLYRSILYRTASPLVGLAVLLAGLPLLAVSGGGPGERARCQGAGG
jgi:amino acid transporter